MTVCERWMTRPASGSQRPPCTTLSSISGNFFHDLGGLDEAGARAEGLGRSDLALDFVHALVVADAGDFEAADALIVAELLVEIDRIERRPAGQEVVAGGVAEIRGVRRRGLMSVGMPDLSMPTMSSQPRSIRWWTTEAPTMPPSPMTTTFAFDGNSAIAHDPGGILRRTIAQARRQG